MAITQVIFIFRLLKTGLFYSLILGTVSLLNVHSLYSINNLDLIHMYSTADLDKEIDA